MHNGTLRLQNKPLILSCYYPLFIVSVACIMVHCDFRTNNSSYRVFFTSRVPLVCGSWLRKISWLEKYICYLLTYYVMEKQRKWYWNSPLWIIVLSIALRLEVKRLIDYVMVKLHIFLISVIRYTNKVWSDLLQLAHYFSRSFTC